MPKLSVKQQNINELFRSKKSDFLIPDYQRPYAWTETECQILWEDLLEFSFPEDNCNKFNKNDEYFLGSIVLFIKRHL